MQGVGMSSDSTDGPAMSNQERGTQNKLGDSGCTPDFRGKIQIESISCFKEILRIRESRVLSELFFYTKHRSLKRNLEAQNMSIQAFKNTP